jgi:hypothetical protein
MNPTKNLIELKLYMKPTKTLIELKLYMNPAKKLDRIKMTFIISFAISAYHH